MGHLQTLAFCPQESIVDVNGQLEMFPTADQAVHLKSKERSRDAQLFGNTEKVGVAGVNQIQNLLIVQQKIGCEEVCFAFQSACGLIDIKVLHCLTAEMVGMLENMPKLMTCNDSLFFIRQMWVDGYVPNTVYDCRKATQTIHIQRGGRPELCVG